MLTPQQIAMRRNGLGASDIPAVLGLNPWRKPIDVYLDKIGAMTRGDDTAAIRAGHRLEPVLRRWYAEDRGMTVQEPGTLVHPKYKWALATPDGIAWKRRTRQKDKRLVEIKTAGPNTIDDWTDEEDGVPDYYAAQGYWQMIVTGIPVCDFAALLAGQEFRIYTIEQDDALAATMIEAASEFWHKNVLRRVPPPADGSKAYAKYLQDKYGSARRVMHVAPPEAEPIARRLATAQAEIATQKSIAAQAENELCSMIGDATGIFGRWGRATWRPEAGRVAWRKVAMAANASADLIDQHRGDDRRRFRLSLRKAKGAAT